MIIIQNFIAKKFLVSILIMAVFFTSVFDINPIKAATKSQIKNSSSNIEKNIKGETKNDIKGDIKSNIKSNATKSKKTPKKLISVELEADEIHFDEKQESITAIGNVVAKHNKKILRSNEIRYLQKKDIMQSNGKSVLEDDGDVYEADNFEITVDLKQGILDNLTAHLADKSTISAKHARRKANGITYFEDAIYTPCTIFCRGKVTDKDTDKFLNEEVSISNTLNRKKKAPLWQLRAKKITYNKNRNLVSYDSVYSDIYGVPILYAPWFMHYLPSKESKMGFLPPRYISSSVLGSAVKTPYYIPISKSAEITIIPVLASSENSVIEVEGKALAAKGDLNLSGSLTNPNALDDSGNKINGKHDLRGHIMFKGSNIINDLYDFGFSLNRTTDDTYMRRYSYGRDNVLISSNYLNRIEDRSYAQIRSIYFQDLRADSKGKPPLILPEIRFSHQSDLGEFGERYRLHGNIRSIRRSEGADSQRAILKGDLELPYVDDSGVILSTKLSSRFDIYHVENFNYRLAGVDRRFSGNKTRFVPRLSLEAKYPLIYSDYEISSQLEPIVKLTISDKNKNPWQIPDEDSGVSEFSYTNLFDDSRFSGEDRVEEGADLVYGLQGLIDNDGNEYSFIIGQLYDISADNPFVSGNAGRYFSDYVGNLALTLPSWLNFNADYNFRAQSSDGKLLISELKLSASNDDFNISSIYSYSPSASSQNVQESAHLDGGYNISDNWQYLIGGQYDLLNNESVNLSSGFHFANECVKFAFGIKRDFTRDRDAEPSTTYSVRVELGNFN